MSNEKKRISVPHIMQTKNKTPIVCLTAYTAPMARQLDNHADLLLVGDSLGMVIYGMDNTLSVTMDMMIAHGRAVAMNTRSACVVIDMPFGSFESSKEHAFDNAARLISATGAQAVKLEGGVEMAETISFLCQRGVAVMGHVGLLPQRVHSYGGFRMQGKERERAEQIKADAMAVQEAGAFAVVLESIPVELADEITKDLTIPTIGIGASVNCDGQILVCDDLLGFDEGYVPSFVKKYADLNQVVETAAGQFAADVRARRFPENRHCYDSLDKVVQLKTN